MCVYICLYCLSRSTSARPFITCFIKQNDDDVDDDNHEDDATLSIVIIGFTDGCFMLVSSLGGDLC